ncbi:MAG: hypothetical protein LJE69_14510 [Thiohalocapsa sp.]|uniref:transmembrane-type terpene cyclase n=1 Tax=Thiohalocapsa sp. TaxID=2497641 RepID=UPI0025E068EB|nr:hypothetical protein [Thiohalocapsa sp.]MCG6942449.1 hypothetical protein [Thiohalocapsa sp.]
MQPVSFPTFLTVLSGVCWTLVYIDGIRLGFKQHTYAMPFWALALNIAWEFLHAALGYQHAGLALQTVINGVWALFDVGILYTYLRYGRKWFPKDLPAGAFILWTLLGLTTAAVVQYGFVVELGLVAGRAYAAFLQNLLMSVLFIGMFAQRAGSEGQSLTIAVNKWVGTLAPTILFGVVGAKGFDGPNRFILAIGLLCSVFDLIYIALLVRAKARERRGEPSRRAERGELGSVSVAD